jgi:hypothetical protein
MNFLVVYCPKGHFGSDEFLKWEFSSLTSTSVLVVSYTILNAFKIPENDRRLISAILAIITYTTIVPPYIKQEDFRLWSGVFWSAVLVAHLFYMKCKRASVCRADGG